MDLRPTGMDAAQTVGGVSVGPAVRLQAPAAVPSTGTHPARLPDDAFHPTGTPVLDSPAGGAPTQEPPVLLVALEDPVRASEVPGTLPVLEKPPVERTPAPTPVGVTLSEALRHAVQSPPQPAPKAPEFQIPEIRLGGSQASSSPARAPRKSARVAKPSQPDSTGPKAPAGPAAPAAEVAPRRLEAPKPAELPPPTELPELERPVMAGVLRTLRRVENLLLSAVGKGNPALDLEPELEAINRLGPALQKLSDAELRGKTVEFRSRLAAGESLDDLRTEAYAVAREAAARTLKMRPFDVQVLGALAMGQNQIAEMKTGEGKTLTEVLPVYLNALAGKGTHVVTVNETLAERDCEQMRPVFESLGLTVGLVKDQMSPEERRAGYAADITYATNTTLGFDYLRDQTAQRPQDRVQREPFFALVDEVDEVLIDEARTPLILSVKDRPAEGEYRRFAEVVADLAPGTDYQVNRKKHQAWVTDEGLQRVEERLGLGNLYAEENLHLVTYLQKAVEARGLFVKDRDYIVQDGKVQIVDEFTGRVLEDRRYNDGLHQALEAREGVEIQPEQRTMASITYPNLFRRYSRLAGMSGTAKTEEGEFQDLYGLSVVPIPTHKPVARVDEPDVVYRTQEEKFAAVADQVDQLFREGRPVLLGTRSIQVNEYLSGLLAARGIPHQVLNAKSVKDNTSAENDILAEAGRSGMVTLATNMAGRGVDIKPDLVNYKRLAIEVSERTARGEAVVVDLGKAKEAQELGRWLEMGQIPMTTVTSPSEAPAPGSVQMRVGVDAPAPDGTTRLAGGDFPTGGLYVIGTERHESRRIDDQLRGRSGRQGQVGGSRFYVSLEDDLMRHFGGPKLAGILDRLGVPKRQGLTDPLVAKLVRSAQEKVEEHHFTVRKDTTKYDQVLNKHREVFYGDRNRIVDGADLREEALNWGSSWLAREILGEHDPEQKIQPDQLAQKIRRAGERLDLPMPELHVEDALPGRALAGLLRAELEARYEVLEQRFGAEALRDQERWLALQVMDQAWTAHLEGMEEMKQGVGLVAYAEKDPWLAYQERSFELFTGMQSDIAGRVGQDLFAEVLREVPRVLKTPS